MQCRRGTHQGLALLGHAHAVVVGLEEAVAPELQRIAHVHGDAAGLGRAVCPVVHLRGTGAMPQSEKP